MSDALSNPAQGAGSGQNQSKNKDIQKKVFAGAHIRRLRRELAMTQAGMAEEIGISTSYLNLIERNQRPVSAQILLRLADLYDIDLKALAGSDEERTLAELREVMQDPVFSGSGVANQDLQDLAMGNPAMAQAVATLYRAYSAAQENAQDLAQRLTDDNLAVPLESQGFPIEEVRDFIHHNANHFATLEETAERLWEEAPLDSLDLYISLRAHLTDYLGVKVRIMPVEVMGPQLRRYEVHGRRLLLSELLEMPGRTFQLAYQVALSGYRPLLDELVESSGIRSEETKRLCRISLANYFAGAIMMPYEKFRQAAESLRYDIDILGQRFGASFEQVAHRLTTMQRPGSRGVPFFLIRVDNAGNISKRFSAGSFHFARQGGACPRWNVHDAFQTPGKIYTQVIEMPDGTRYFSLARTVKRVGGGLGRVDQQLALGLGCDLNFAKRLVYSDGFDLDHPEKIVTEIGPNCRLCERENCAQRAFPPLSYRLEVNENQRGLSPFSFTRT